MDAEDRPFEPDWTLHPGVALREVLIERKVTPEALAAEAGLDPATVEGILAFTTAVTPYVARRLGERLGVSAQFWLNYQANYERDLARGAKDVSRKDQGNAEDPDPVRA